MKICVVGHHVTQPDEGVRKVAYYLARELASRHEVMAQSIRDTKGWASIRTFRPDVIHYVLSPTLAGLAVAKFLSFAHGPAATVMSAPHPDLASLGRLASLFRPDLTLVQAYESERRFQSWGYQTRFLPNGVETERFVPVSQQAKERLRKKYNIDKDRFVILHVASMKRGRNLQLMQRLQGDGNQVLIVGRPSEKGDSQPAQDLRQRGCIVWTEYLPRLEEIYALSDCYVFPTTVGRYCIEMPLSVMEAMSCNLPVVTSRFGALPRVFDDGDGFTFANSEGGFLSNVEKVKSGVQTRTREKVLPYAWDKVVSSLEEIYEEIADRGGA